MGCEMFFNKHSYYNVVITEMLFFVCFILHIRLLSES